MYKFLWILVWKKMSKFFVLFFFFETMSTTILLWLMFNTLMMVAMHQIPIVIHVGGDYSVATNMTGFPYKPIYGLPDHLNCAHELRKEFYECENYAKQSWLITLDEYVRIVSMCVYV